MSQSLPKGLVELEQATRAWHEANALDVRVARTRADLGRLDQEAARTGHPFAAGEARAAREHLAHLEGQRAALGDARARYEAAAAAREAEVRSAGHPAAGRLAEIAQARGRLLARLQEADEAVAAGQRAEHALVVMRQAMEQVWQSGAVDSAIGVNLFADIEREQRTTEAADLVLGVNNALAALARELADLHVPPTFAPLPPIQRSAPLTLLDSLANPVAESVRTLRVSRATNQVTVTLWSVRGILQRLAAGRAADQAELDALGAERHRLLQQAHGPGSG